MAMLLGDSSCEMVCSLTPETRCCIVQHDINHISYSTMILVTISRLSPFPIFLSVSSYSAAKLNFLVQLFGRKGFESLQSSNVYSHHFVCSVYEVRNGLVLFFVESLQEGCVSNVGRCQEGFEKQYSGFKCTGILLVNIENM